MDSKHPMLLLLAVPTTLIEFVNQEQGRCLVETLDDYRKNDAEGIAMVDYAFTA